MTEVFLRSLLKTYKMLIFSTHQTGNYRAQNIQNVSPGADVSINFSSAIRERVWKTCFFDLTFLINPDLCLNVLAQNTL